MVVVVRLAVQQYVKLTLQNKSAQELTQQASLHVKRTAEAILLYKLHKTSQMTSTEARGASATREFALALASGGLYGATNTIVGHPFDTVKTKMQTQSGFTNSGALASARQILSSEGAVGFYRGCLPPMWGSAVYRSAQFAVYDLLYAEAEKKYPASLEHVPGTDMEWRVLGAGAVGATARTVLESPIEYAKVKGQTNQRWRLNEVYRGAGLQWARTGPMMTLYFCLFDACKRNGYASTPAGQFFSSGGCALVGFWVVWPFENLKNQAQAGKNWAKHARATGLLGLYRGLIPGSLSVFLRNGAAMIVMQKANRLITELGLRGD